MSLLLLLPHFYGCDCQMTLLLFLSPLHFGYWILVHKDLLSVGSQISVPSFAYFFSKLFQTPLLLLGPPSSLYLLLCESNSWAICSEKYLLSEKDELLFRHIFETDSYSDTNSEKLYIILKNEWFFPNCFFLIFSYRKEMPKKTKLLRKKQISRNS